MLVLAGIKIKFLQSFFFLSMGLCFIFKMESVLITQGYFIIAGQCLKSIKAPPPGSGLGVHKVCGTTRNWEETPLRQLTLNDPRDISDHRMSSQQINLEKGGMGDPFAVMVFDFPSNCYNMSFPRAWLS